MKCDIQLLKMLKLLQSLDSQNDNVNYQVPNCQVDIHQFIHLFSEKCRPLVSKPLKIAGRTWINNSYTH